MGHEGDLRSCVWGGNLRSSKRRPGGVRLHGHLVFAAWQFVTCRPACVGMLQSGGSVPRLEPRALSEAV